MCRRVLFRDEKSLQLDKDGEEEGVKGAEAEPEEREAFVEAEGTFLREDAAEAAEGVAILGLTFFLGVLSGHEIRS